ncbi:rhodanese-like domain-containing protein [Arcobacter sp. LA11]|uniref:rhodanese-like domain-containing protein n=1 Tax=Arcobacter sp. LA11 TaxID=1898176 RepID=UPI000932BF30|nr:rhodanese-like domain-containing protein [Arcobacter sp. LA11]
MNRIILLIFSFVYMHAINPIMLPIKGVEVEHLYSNGVKEKITIEREVAGICMNIAVNVENFQSENLASSKINELCKKTLVTTKGVIQPLRLKAGITTVAELEVLDFIENRTSKDSNKYILVDSRTSDWFDAGTIPSAINIPYDELEYDEDFEIEYERAYKNLGVKILDKNKFDFTNAKTTIFFCNGSWCAQSPRAIKHLVKIGYPKERILWYRGGIASWVSVSLSLTKNIEAKE